MITTALYFVVFGSALGSRMTTMDGVSFGAFIVPGLTLLSRVHAVDLQRQLRHLFSEVYGHDLRTSLSSDLELRGGARLCRRGGDQVGDPRAGDARHGDAVRAGAASIIRSR